MSMDKLYPRVLVLANNSFSKSNSNGRTLGSLFWGWPKARLAQFAIMCLDTDFDLCENYYQVKDTEALHALLKGEKAVTGREVSEAATKGVHRSQASGRKTAWRMILRNMVWNSRRWAGRRFREWIDDFCPEVVLVQSGDSAFMLSLARRIAKERKIPLVIFNTEGYLFFHHNFMHHHWSDAIAFPIFKRHYNYVFKKTLAACECSVYGNEKLRKDYCAFMPHRATVFYSSSSLEFAPKPTFATPPQISYLGNLGIRRTEALAEVGSVLQSISPELHIDVYGSADQAKADYLNQSPGVRFHGMLSYDEVVNKIRESDILFHVEKNDPILCRELRYAFSTKIADSICSGHNFVIYAPANLACSQYVIETGAAWHADTPETLRKVLLQLLSPHDPRREEVLEKARLASRAHKLETNAEMFRQTLASVVSYDETSDFSTQNHV